MKRSRAALSVTLLVGLGLSACATGGQKDEEQVAKKPECGANTVVQILGCDDKRPDEKQPGVDRETVDVCSGDTVQFAGPPFVVFFASSPCADGGDINGLNGGKGSCKVILQPRKDYADVKYGIFAKGCSMTTDPVIRVWR